MRNCLPIEKIQSTETYKALELKKEFTKMSFLRTRVVRSLITHGFLVWQNTKVIPGNISGINLQVFKDLIADHEQSTDRSIIMTCENLDI